MKGIELGEDVFVEGGVAPNAFDGEVLLAHTELPGLVSGFFIVVLHQLKFVSHVSCRVVGGVCLHYPVLDGGAFVGCDGLIVHAGGTGAHVEIERVLSTNEREN